MKCRKLHERQTRLIRQSAADGKPDGSRERLIGSDTACEQLREDFAQANQHAGAQCRRHIVAGEIRLSSRIRARGLGKAGGTPGKNVGRRGRQSAGHDTLTARKNDACFHFGRGPGGLKVPEAIARTDVLLIA